MDKLLTAINNTPNNAYPIFNPDSSLGGNVNYNNNIGFIDSEKNIGKNRSDK